MRHELGAGKRRPLSPNLVAEGLRGLGLELDEDKIDAIRRLGAPQVMKSLVELGNYFKSTKTNKRDDKAYDISDPSVNVASLPSKGHLSTGAADSMPIKDVHPETRSSGASSQGPLASMASKQPPAAPPVPAASEPIATTTSLPVDAILRGVRRGKYCSDPYGLYRKLQSHGGSLEGVHRGLGEAGVCLNAEDYAALLWHTTHTSPQKGGEVDVAALVRGITGLPGGSTVGLGHDTRKDGADMRRSRTCRVERSLERHIHTFLQTRGADSVTALLQHDGDKSGYMDKERLVSVLTRDLGLHLSPSDLEAGLRRLPINDQGQVAYVRLLQGGGHGKALKKSGLPGHTQAAATVGERGWNGLCGNEVADRIGRMLRSRYGSVEDAFRVVLESGEGAAGGSSKASDPSVISKRDLHWALGYLGMRLSDRNLDLLVSSLNNSGTPPDPLAKPRAVDRQHVDLSQVISLLEQRRHPSEVSKPLTPPPPPEKDDDPEALPARDVVHKNSSGRMRSIITCEGRVEGPREWEGEGKGGWLGEMGLTRRERRFRERCSSAPPRCRSNGAREQKQEEGQGEGKDRVAGVSSDDFITNRRVLRRLYKNGRTVRQSSAVRALLDPDASSTQAPNREATCNEIFGHHSQKGRAAPVERYESVSHLMRLQAKMSDEGTKQPQGSEKEDAHAVFGPQARRRHFRPHDTMGTLFSPRKEGEVVNAMGSAWCMKRRPQSALASSRGMSEVLKGRGSHASEEREGNAEGPKGAGKPSALREHKRNLRKSNPKRYEVCAPLAEPLYGIE